MQCPAATGRRFCRCSSSCIDHSYRARKFHGEFVEKWRRERALHAGNFLQLVRANCAFDKILVRPFRASLLCRAGRDERWRPARRGPGWCRCSKWLSRGGYVARAWRASERIRAGLRVGGLSGEAAGHLPDKFVARGDDADVRPAVAWRQTEALAFHRDDVGFGGRLHHSQRNAFGDRNDQQRAGLRARRRRVRRPVR